MSVTRALTSSLEVIILLVKELTLRDKDVVRVKRSLFVFKSENVSLRWMKLLFYVDFRHSVVQDVCEAVGIPELSLSVYVLLSRNDPLYI